MRIIIKYRDGSARTFDRPANLDDQRTLAALMKRELGLPLA